MTSETPYSERFHVSDPVHGDVPCIELGPGRQPGLPICLFLYGGGGSCETLLDLRPLLAQAWAGGTLPPCRVVTPDVGPWSFYLDDPARGTAWESLVAERLLRHLHGDVPVEKQAPVAAVGISMGGYGALKMAFARPGAFRAVAAVAPMVEPAFTAAEVRPRNRYHYPPTVPAALLGPQRDARLYETDHPAGRARRNADTLRGGPLAIYLDAGADDALNAHDGAEFLHRVLWELDIRHAYRLWADADHVGPSVVPRLEAAFAWAVGKLRPATTTLTPLEIEWQRWLDGGGVGPMPAPLSPTSPLMGRLLRQMLAPLRLAASAEDATVQRLFGPLPSPAGPSVRDEQLI